MFYINILNQPPRKSWDHKIPCSTAKLEQKRLVQQHQLEVRRTQQKLRKDYPLERRLFI